MASRFEIVNDEYIEELKDKSKNENTKNNAECWKNVFKKWANERNLQANLEENENDVLDQRLSQFQLSIQKFSNFARYVISLWKIYSCLFIPNCTRNPVITYTKCCVHPRWKNLWNPRMTSAKKANDLTKQRKYHS